MADNILEDSSAVPAGTDWFDTWLETGTVAQRSVNIYGRPDLFAKYEDLERRREIAAAVEEDGEKSVGDSTLSDLEAEISALYAQWQDSKTTWYIRALNPEEIDAVKDECGFPEELPKDADAAAQKAFEREAEKANTSANQIMVSRALVKIENNAGEVVRESITPEQVGALRSKLGEQQVLRLVAAAMVASTQEVSIPVPLSRGNSKSDRS